MNKQNNLFFAVLHKVKIKLSYARELRTACRQFRCICNSIYVMDFTAQPGTDYGIW